MKILPVFRTAWRILGCLALCGAGGPVLAFPPAPHHIIHGMVRDELGEPISLAAATVLLESTNGASLTCLVDPEVRPGENYRLIVPMDSFIAPDSYKANALHAAVPFRLKVKIGQSTFVPVEMAGNFSSLGKPAGDTLLNLTLGVDSDGDGLPDSWEYALIQMLGGGLSLADITPDGDNDSDGISNYNEYIAGTYAFDAEDGLKLSLLRQGSAGPVIQFFGISGRTYTIQGTTNLVDWSPMSFRLPGGATAALPVQDYYIRGSQLTEVEVLLPAAQPPVRFFRMQVR
jgi:hypothetical protein